MKIREICNITMGQSPSSATYNENGDGLPFFQGAADFGKKFPMTRVWCSSPLKIAYAGDILISVRAPVGTMNIATSECCIGRGLAAIKVDEDACDSDYFWFALESKISELNNKGSGSTFKAISKSILEETEIPLPELEEQRKIAKILTGIENISFARQQQLAKLDELVKARFVEMFGDPIVNPNGYCVMTLQEMIDMGDIIYHLDGNHGGDYPRSDEFVEAGVPYISANCIVNGEIDFSKAKYLTEKRAGKLRKGIACDSDVLFAHNATVGPTVILHTTEEKVILGTSLTAYRCNTRSLLPEYLKSFMLSDAFVKQYSEEMKQTTRNQVPITQQKKYLFLKPPVFEQQRFADFIKQTDKIKLSIQKSLEQMETLKKSLMQQYFG